MSNRYVRMRSRPVVAIVSRMAALCVLVTATLASASAQTSYTSFGRQFLIAFPDTTQTHVRKRHDPLEAAVSLSIFSLDTARVTISAPGFLRTVIVLPDRSNTVLLSDPVMRPTRLFVDVVNTPLPASFDVRSDRPIAVTAYFATIHGAEAFTPMPVEQWGREYFAASLNQWFVYNALQVEEKYTYVAAPAALVVIASEDNTDVTIETQTPVFGPATRTVMLNAGDTYLVETSVPGTLDSLATPDLSGTHISATKPIGVISGNTRTLGSRENPIPLDPLPSNAMSNTAYEWLHPVDDHGHTFIYRQFSAVAELTSTELIRVYGTSPGTTTVTTTNGGPPMSLAQGSFIEFSSKAWRPSDALQPFAVRTDRPVQTFVFTASSASLTGNRPDTIEMETHTWSPAMAELVPRERWITLGRYNAPIYPGGMQHYLVIAADSGATVFLDGAPVAWDPLPVTGTTYRHARVPVAAGDHALRSSGGRFTATAFGQRRGYAAFRPDGAKPPEDPDGVRTGRDTGDVTVERAGYLSADIDGSAALRDPGTLPNVTDGVAAHPTYYLEILSLAYAMPVPGISDFVPPLDSIEFARVDRCDSSVVTATRLGSTWSSSIIEASVAPGSRNADVSISKTFNNTLHIGFRIRFMPVDPMQDAEATVVVANDAGQRWTIPFTYKAFTVALTPSTVELLAIAAGVKQTIPLTLTNQKPFTTTVLDVRLKNGAQGFTLGGREVLPKPLAAGGSFGMTLEFVGAEAGRLYRDTIVIYSVCDSMIVPISAYTAPPEPAPLPLITGYDWGLRRVGSVNDTLSFISNAGTLPFTVDRVEIVGDPDGAFMLVDPPVSALPVVEPAARHAIGIRFIPPTEGSYVADIMLITTDGDSARAGLRGISALARIDVEDLDLGPSCVGLPIDTAIAVAITGSAPTRIDSFVVTATNARVEIDTAWIGLPKTLTPGETMLLRARIVGLAAGSLDVTIVAVADATGDSVARITGVIDTCATPGIDATDHDFGRVLVTRSRQGVVHVVNTGQVDVTVETMRIIEDAELSFRVLGPPPPFVVPQGDSVAVDVDFTPTSVGTKSARVEYATSAGIVYSVLAGIGERLVAPARIPRYYRGEPGQEKVVAVILDTSIDVTGAVSLPVTVGYDATLLDFLGLRDTAAAQVELRLVATAPGEVSFELRPRGDSLMTGPIAALRFLVRIAVEDSSELPLTITSTLPWLEFLSSPGLFVRDPWCGLAERLFEFTAGTLALAPVRPSPVRSDAIVEFGVPVDGVTTLAVVDAIGVERLRLVDAYLRAGSYAVSIPAGSLPSGPYFVRLICSGMQLVERFVVE